MTTRSCSLQLCEVVGWIPTTSQTRKPLMAGTCTRESFSFAPPRLGRLPGNLASLRRRQGLRSGGATSLAAHPCDSGELLRGKVLGTGTSTLGSAELAEGYRVGVFLAWHGEATIVRYRTSVVLT
jgi:hypothetical protein